MAAMNAHLLARLIADALDDTETGETTAWTTEETGLSSKGLKEHKADPNYCVLYVTIENTTYSLVVQRADT